MRGVALLRLFQVLPALGAFVPVHWDRSAGLIAALAGTEIVWSAGVMAFLWRRRIDALPRLAVFDAALALFCVFAVGRLQPANRVSTTDNWSLGVANAAAILVILVIGSAVGLSVLAALVATYALSMWHAGVGYELLVAASNIASLIGFTVTARVVTAKLFQSALAVDDATAREVAAEGRRSAAAAATAERQRQYIRIHDTVLQTLSALARGGLAADDPHVQQRCAEDAALLRGLFVDPPITEPGPGVDLRGVLQRVTDYNESALTIHTALDLPPLDVPADVAESLEGATNEALANVFKHAGTAEAWVSASVDDGGRITVSVEDRGAGFGHEALPQLRGVRHSILDRLEAVGGTAQVGPRPGGGTVVTLEWGGL